MNGLAMADTGQGEDLGALGERIVAALADKVERCYVEYGELNVVAKAAEIVAVMQRLCADSACLFINLIDITAVDYPAREKRFDVVYHLQSPKHNRRIRVKAAVAEEEPIPSVIEVFPSANWFERETYDMFGVIFSGHPRFASPADGLRLRRLSVAQGFPDDRLCRGAL